MKFDDFRKIVASLDLANFGESSRDGSGGEGLLLVVIA
jgi:hypothetical protein